MLTIYKAIVLLESNGFRVRKLKSGDIASPCALPAHDDAKCEAIALLETSGYCVRQLKSNKPRYTARVGPTFVATFHDGVVTRMSVFTKLSKLDVERGARLSQAAYRSRKRTETVPPIMRAHFERDGQVLARYSRDGATNNLRLDIGEMSQRALFLKEETLT